jgi:hypothetical protein
MDTQTVRLTSELIQAQVAGVRVVSREFSLPSRHLARGFADNITYRTEDFSWLLTGS